ncbi:MAG TPA: putative zinc-binding metallopeptidase [Kofleriaceae bacterium]|nr:putative zinc-binding metallopeptidase [Kofleriaceae bacterium]
MLAADRAPAAILALSERTAALDLASVARHELGHALVFLDDRATRTRGFLHLFGDVRTRYRVGTAADEVERRLRARRGLDNPRYRRVVSLYAATHPHERFAEAVKMALACRGDLARAKRWVAQHALDELVTAQIAYACDWLVTYRKR